MNDQKCSADIWSREVAQEISLAIDNRDLDRVSALLNAHSGNLLNQGNDFLLSTVAGMCWLDGVKALVAAGIDVNASANIGKGTPFYQPEGPILAAVTNGCTPVVEWLLENGAEINFEVDGERRCLSLFTAIRNGHAEIVELLVEHGADLHAVWGRWQCNDLS